MQQLISSQAVGWFSKPPPPPPPPPAVDVLQLVVAATVVLLTALLVLRLRGGGGAASSGHVNGGTGANGAKRKPRPSAEYPRGPLLVLWGSQTGTAEGFANELAREGRQKGFNAKSIDLEEYDHERLGEEKAPCVFLMATHGEGEPTDNAAEFYTWANDEEVSSAPLEGLRYSVFALGNTQYEHYCYMGRWCDRRLAELGASAFLELGEGNDDEDIHADFEGWREKLWAKLIPDEQSDLPTGGGAATLPTSSFECELLPEASAPRTTLDWLSAAFPKLALFECVVDSCRELTADAGAKNGHSSESGSVKHVELRCEAVGKGGQRATVAYAGADDLGVCCDNGQELAAATASRLGLSLGQVFALKPMSTEAQVAPPLPTPCTVECALRFHCDLRAAAPKPLLLLLAAHASDPTEAARLRHLASAAGKAEYTSYVQTAGRGLSELLGEFGSCVGLPWAAVLELVPKLTPRYYTISSAPEANPSTVSLTVKVLREPMRGAEGRTKEGVCSTQLGALPVGGRAIVFVRASAFRLPASPATPVIMVGPGTGVAPFRAFTQQLSALPSRRSGEAILYFGCRHKQVDFLYRTELEAAEKSGALTQVRAAFSRDNAHKVYVQHLLREDGARLHELLATRGAHMYICGGTSMGREVVALLAELYEKHGGLDAQGAAAAVKRLTAAGRLVQELWS